MVSSCIVPRCKRRRRTGLSYYRFPVKDAERCKLWLRAVNNPKYDEDTAMDCLRNHRVCSLHFKPEDFERHLVWEAMGGDGVRKLRPTAVPSLSLDQEAAACAEQVIVPITTAQASALVASGASVTSVLPWASVSSSILSGAPSISSCPPPRAKLGESVFSSSVSHLSKPIHQETDLSSATESTSDEASDRVLSQAKTIVNDSCLMDLFKKCQTCGQSINDRKVSQCGAQKRVRWSCLGGHRGMWMSSPYLPDAFPEIHLLTTLSILFSGGTFVQFKKWAKHLHLNFMANKTFLEIQKAYVNPDKTQMNTTALGRQQQRGGSYVQIADGGHCVSGGFLFTRTEKGPLKKIKSNLQRREKAALSLQSRCEKRSPVLSTTSGAGGEALSASKRGFVLSSEAGRLRQQEDVEHLGRARHEASEVKCLQDSFEEMEVTIETEAANDCNNVKNRICKLQSEMVNVSGPTALRAAGADDSRPEDIYVPIIPQRSTTSKLLLECEEEDLEPWQKQNDLKNEDDAGESTNEETDCKSEPSAPPRYATNTSPPALKTETPQAVGVNGQVTGSFVVKSLQPLP